MDPPQGWEPLEAAELCLWGFLYSFLSKVTFGMYDSRMPMKQLGWFEHLRLT
jgi:hypothetical protein